ncbi:hypothetical protein SUGI_0918840 [Cryptomeria japonica]|nr:hypothetical protein SUGI_0918840 [Cryptomeria japonica]
MEPTTSDFRNERIIGSTIDKVPRGYDHNYVLNCGETKNGLKHAVKINDPSSREELYTDQLCRSTSITFRSACNIENMGC